MNVFGEADASKTPYGLQRTGESQALLLRGTMVLNRYRRPSPRVEPAPPGVDTG